MPDGFDLDAVMTQAASGKGVAPAQPASGGIPRMVVRPAADVTDGAAAPPQRRAAAPAERDPGAGVVGREALRANRIVRRNGKGDDFVNAQTEARERTMQPMHGTVAAVAGAAHHGILFNGLAHFAQADDFVSVAQAAAELLVGAGTA